MSNWLSNINRQLAFGGEVYKYIVPGPASILKAGRLKNVVVAAMQIPTVISAVKNRKRLPEFIGEQIGGQIVGSVFAATINKPIHKVMRKAATTRRPLIKKNGIGGRTWFGIEGDRNIRQMVVMFHDAERAGKHLDVHIGAISLIIRVSGKPIEAKIKYNSKGFLTELSKDALIDHLRTEVQNGSRIVQNMDHSISNAKCSWSKGQGKSGTYGFGLTRQLVFEEPIEIMSVDNGIGKTTRLYCPKVWKHSQTYIHKLYSGDKKKAPVVVWGVTKPEIPEFEPKLDLTMIQPDQIEKFKKKVDPKTVTRKYDSASAYFDSKDGRTSFWSPRISKETGRHIEYTHKVPELFRASCGVSVKGMGELLFREKFNHFNPEHWFDSNRYLSAAEAGGILNADKVRPLNIAPDFRIYRIDRFDGKNVINLDFFANRCLAANFAGSNRFMNFPEFSEIKERSGWEGLVGVPKGKGINDGIKVKFVSDPVDWKIEDVQLERGPKGRIAGVVWFRSLESGKAFKMGASQLGDDKFVMEIMNNPKAFVGQVFKIKSRVGHEGRAAKLIEPHLDKGIG